MEVGPLARMIVGYAAGQKDIRAAVDGVLKKLNAPASVLYSTLGRLAARAVESHLMATQLQVWLDQLSTNLDHGNVKIFNPVHWDPGTWPAKASGFGWHEAPRGSLGHWIESEAAPSKIIRRWCPPRGMRGLGTPRVSGALMKRRSRQRRSPIPRARSRFCAPFTPSIRAWLAPCTSSMPRGASTPCPW